MTELREGQLLRGHVSLSGGDDGPLATWIVVAPHGRHHIHSIDDPLDLHCWPLYAAEQGVKNGSLEYLAHEPDHPIIQLQRAKEAFGIVDAHLGLTGDLLEAMLHLLEDAVSKRRPYAHYAAGEVLTLIHRAFHSSSFLTAVDEQVHRLLAKLEAETCCGT